MDRKVETKPLKGIQKLVEAEQRAKTLAGNSASPVREVTPPSWTEIHEWRKWLGAGYVMGQPKN